MKRVNLIGMLAIALSCAACDAAEPLDLAKFLQMKGWKLHNSTQIASSPTAEVAPIMYYDKGNSVPSCGLLTASGQSRDSQFIEIVGSEPGVNFPQCMSIVSMVPFKLQNRDYIAVEYVSRETREDINRGFFYVYRDSIKGYITDEELTEAVPSTATDVSAVKPLPAKRLDGVKAARAAQLAKTFRSWRFLDRDFIADSASSFATFENRETQQCLFVAEAGAGAVSLSHTEFAHASKCLNVLASSRLENDGKIYYLAIFKSGDGKQLVAVLSVGTDKKISAEKTLAEAINRSGATDTIRNAKAALLRVSK